MANENIIYRLWKTIRHRILFIKHHLWWHLKFKIKPLIVNINEHEIVAIIILSVFISSIQIWIKADTNEITDPKHFTKEVKKKNY